MPDATDNDPWADLYADLGVTEKPARPAPAPHAEAAHPGDTADESAEGDDGDEDSDTEGGDGVATADDGTTKKRRRRRRRGKKKPGEETAPGSEGAGQPGDGPDENETPEYGRHAAQPTPHRSPAPVADYESDIDAESETDDAGQPAEVSAEAERPLEGATTEMTRELIANWNVPSWEDLVTGLHRPSH